MIAKIFLYHVNTGPVKKRLKIRFHGSNRRYAVGDYITSEWFVCGIDMSCKEVTFRSITGIEVVEKGEKVCR